ncbi:hypothetical protein E1287_30750 [Actinomadura sp. KC06]|uniref:FAD/NAD(P)-binding protein n=1 Tax=Actinomadura sp. KC06 TaxID=2530369 RepID=UPI0010507081|nr:FAD/NAD(P)-binding protein [Actinomadura sp. KC06]TDD29608.1 hypothetical protein E1287_30750 [Actinomadura sp. KC06]
MAFYGPSITVIGGGAAAACLVATLEHRTRTVQPGALRVIKARGETWRGVAFPSDGPMMLANVPVQDMSLAADDPEHLPRWLRARGYGDRLDDRPETWYPPRALIGEYITHTADMAMERLAERGWLVEIVYDRVASIDDAWTTRLALRTELGRSIPADHAVLCVGAAESTDPYSLGNPPHYIAEPYPLQVSARPVPAEDRIGVLGSGLTAVDVVVALHAQGHRGPITLVSRNGVLPAVRQPKTEATASALTIDRLERLAGPGESFGLDQLIALVGEELAAHGHHLSEVEKELDLAEPPAERLSRHLDGSGGALPLLQKLIPEMGQDAWFLLRERDKRHVLDYYGRALFSLCCPMPPENAAMVLEKLHSSQLAVLAGVKDASAASDGTFILKIGKTTVTVDWLVNAIGLKRGRIPTGAQPLAQSLLDGQGARAHPLGGFSVERTTSRLLTPRGPNPRLHALGDITVGAYLFTFGVPVLVMRADRIIRDIYRNDHVSA